MSGEEILADAMTKAVSKDEQVVWRSVQKDTTCLSRIKRKHVLKTLCKSGIHFEVRGDSLHMGELIGSLYYVLLRVLSVLSNKW
jgi:hypothetical protein